MKRLVLFDIDYTIFDTDLYREKLYKKLGDVMGLSFDEFKKLAPEVELQTKTKKGYFDPDTYFGILATYSYKSTTTAELNKTFWNNNLYIESLEKNVEKVLRKLKNKNITIGVLSTGNEKHQCKKIEALMNVLDKEHIHIFNNKIVELKNVIEKYPDEKLYIVDDLPTVLAAAKQLSPQVVTIWRKRDKVYEQTDMVENFTPDHTISHVDQILTFLS